jgi:LPXTG-motif cell wall-anchored protein
LLHNHLQQVRIPPDYKKTILLTQATVLTSRFTTTVPSRVSATPTSTANSSPTPTSSILGDEGKGKSKSKAWIAGAVVGPILGLALIGLAAFLVMRRKKNKSHNQHIAPTTGGMPATGATAYQQNTYPTNPASPGPPQYYPNMQQNAGAAPLGVAKQDNYYGQSTNPVSPITSQGSQSPYGAPPQQWQQPGGQPVYGAPSPSMSPAPQTVQPAQYVVSETRPFSSELEGSYNHGKPQLINVQPNK